MSETEVAAHRAPLDPELAALLAKLTGLSRPVWYADVPALREAQQRVWAVDDDLRRGSRKVTL